MRPPEVVPTPVWRRVVARLIDLWPLALVPFGLVGSLLLAVGVAKARSWWAGDATEAMWDDEDDDEEGDPDDAIPPRSAPRAPDHGSYMTERQRQWMKRFSSWELRAEVVTWSALSVARRRNHRSRGARVMGI